MVLTDTELVPGEELGIYLVDLQPNSPVEVWINSEPRLLQTATADAAGEARVTVVIPADIEPGQHRIVVRGTGADGELMSAEMAIVLRYAPSALDGLILVGVLLLLIAAVGMIGFVLVRTRRTRRPDRRGY